MENKAFAALLDDCCANYIHLKHYCNEKTKCAGMNNTLPIDICSSAV